MNWHDQVFLAAEGKYNAEEMSGYAKIAYDIYNVNLVFPVNVYIILNGRYYLYNPAGFGEMILVDSLGNGIVIVAPGTLNKKAMLGNVAADDDALKRPIKVASSKN